MENFESQSNQNNIQNVINELMYIRQETAILGFNDSEILDINKIIEKFENGELSSEEALKEANTIKNRKADYH